MSHNGLQEKRRDLFYKGKISEKDLPFYIGKTSDSMTSTTELRRKEMQALSNSDYIKGLHYYDNGYYDTALFFFNKALARNPKNIGALVSRGTLYSKKKDFLGAFKDMELALDIDRKHEKACKEMSNILVSIAKLYIQHQNPEKAKELLDCALDLDSTKKDAVAVYDEIQKKMVATARFPKQISGSGKKDDRSDGSSSKKGGSKV